MSVHVNRNTKNQRGREVTKNLLTISSIKTVAQLAESQAKACSTPSPTWLRYKQCRHHLLSLIFANWFDAEMLAGSLVHAQLSPAGVTCAATQWLREKAVFYSHEEPLEDRPGALGPKRNENSGRRGSMPVCLSSMPAPGAYGL